MNTSQLAGARTRPYAITSWGTYGPTFLSVLGGEERRQARERELALPITLQTPDAPPTSVNNPTLGNFWVRAYEGDYSICAQTVAWTRTRPFGSVQPIEGGPPVTVTGRPGLRDYAFTIAVNTTADMITVENIIAHPLVFVQFAGHHPDQWMAPRADSYQVIKVGRNRLATVQFVGVEPEPVPSPSEFL